LVFPADLGAVAEDRGTYSYAFATAELSGILRAPVVDPAAVFLGGWADSWFCPAAVWVGGAFPAWLLTGDVRKTDVSERSDLLHSGLRRHPANLGSVAGSGGARSGNGLRLSGRGDRVYPGCLRFVLATRDSNFHARCARGIASQRYGITGAVGGKIGWPFPRTECA